MSDQIVLGFGHIGVIRSQFALVDVQSPFIMLLHFLVLALVLTQQCQVVELFGNVRVVYAENLRVNKYQCE